MRSQLDHEWLSLQKLSSGEPSNSTSLPFSRFAEWRTFLLLSLPSSLLRGQISIGSGKLPYQWLISSLILSRLTSSPHFAGTVIHPRATILALQGPIVIGKNCIVEELAVILNRFVAIRTRSTLSRETFVRTLYLFHSLWLPSLPVVFGSTEDQESWKLETKTFLKLVVVSLCDLSILQVLPREKFAAQPKELPSLFWQESKLQGWEITIHSNLNRKSRRQFF